LIKVRPVGDLRTQSIDRNLTPEAFDRLLTRFDVNRDRAGEKYESLRSQLVKFFECRGIFSPRELTDETINRVARKVLEGEEIPPASFYGYFYGVARNVCREYLRKPESRLTSLECVLPSQHPWENPVEMNQQVKERKTLEQRLECLESCLAKLPAEAQKLITSYYEEEQGAKINNRRRIAEGLGISLNNLRIRVHRIREVLEECVLSCLEDVPN
jgi:RNA polymerase sigma factor (sigma-70 family)